MKSQTGSLLFRGGALLALAAALLLISLPAAAALPEDTCTLVGTTRTCHLWAKTGTVTMPDGAVIPIWGFADTAAGAATLPGPVLIGHEGETMEIVLHNDLPGETVSLELPGQTGLTADLTGVPTGGSTTYSFPLTAGTYLYEAGLTANGPRQVAMGLYGAIVVRSPIPSQAYADPATVYTVEDLLVLSEIDPALNNDPANFSMHTYAPRYFLINGKAYPETAEIPVSAGDTLLLRFVNAGLRSHSMGLLGRYQTMIATDGHIKLPTHRSLVEMVASGQTLDTLVSIIPGAERDSRTLVYDSSMLLHNAGQRLAGGQQLAYGGMMTFVRVVNGAPPSVVGPIVSNLLVQPNPTTGVTGVTLSADVTSDVALVAAEYFTGSLGLDGTGLPLTISGAGPAYAATANIPAAVLATWPSGLVTFYVHGQNADGVWGTVGSAVLNLDKLGPESNALSLWPEPSNGSRPVLLRATGDDHSNGANNVIAGQYTLDGGAALPMTLARIDSPVTAMTATISPLTLQALPQGLHPVAVSSQDSLGNWGAPGIITLTLDTTGPLAVGLSLTPSTLDLTGAPPVVNVRLAGTIRDPLTAGALSNLANAEAFVDVAGPNGTGFDLFASDAMYDEDTEPVYFDIPVSAFLLLSEGVHPVYVHGLDAAGNWGPLAMVQITIERGGGTGGDTTGPTISGQRVAPNPTAGAASVTLTANAADFELASNIASAEWYVNLGYVGQFLPADGAFDSPTEALVANIDVSTWPNGTRTLNMVAYDALGNPGPLARIVLIVEGNNPVQIMADNFDAGDLAAWANTVGNVAVTPEAALDANRAGMGLQATIDGGAPAYVSQVLPVGEKTLRTRFAFDPNSANIGSVHHDILAGLYADKPIMGIQMEAGGNGGYEIRGWALSNGVPLYTGWVDIGDQPHELGLDWQAASQATLSLRVDGQVAVTLDWLDTAAYTVHEVRLGASGNLDPAASGAEYFDNFSARRNMTLFLPTISRGQ